MNQALIVELEHSKQRLAYYTQLKSRLEYSTPGLTLCSQIKAQSKKVSEQMPAVDKWIEIYSDRVKKIEKQAAKLGVAIS